MADFTYPTTDFDRRDELMTTVGSFWSNVFDQREFVEDIVQAKGELENQTLVQLQELFDAVSRFKIPVFHLERLHFLTFLESDRNRGKAAALRYDESTGEVYSDLTSNRYDQPLPFAQSAWDLPAGFHDAFVISNRITDSSLTWTKGVDFQIVDGSIIFQENPFDNELVAKREIFEGDQVVDREMGLWAFRAKFDTEYLFEQFGYVLQLSADSSQRYKDLINASFDALVEGTTARAVEQAFEAFTGVDLVKEEEETVELIRPEIGRILIVTDKHVYQYRDTANVIVSVGQKVLQGDPLVDALAFFDFNRGQCPTPDEVPGLVFGRGYLIPGFFGDLVFENKETDLIVETDENGFTKVSWELGGFPGDVEKFFDELHERGLEDGQTLAQLLDTRTNKVGEPGPSNLPVTINPLQFLCENVLRNNAYLVRLRSSGFGLDAVGLNSAKLLRKLHPPQTAILIVAELAFVDDPITMDGPGTDTAPGYEEAVGTFAGMEFGEAIDPTTMISECVRIKQMAGRCQ
jgi:hypothetical protein